jgi:dephospho-CoA kinase
MIIGVTGTDGAGKGTVVEYLTTQKGFTHYHVRALLIEEIKKQGREPDRSAMREIGNQLRREHGNDFLVTAYIARAQSDGVTHAVIESIRARAEAEALKSAGGILIAVDADPKIRYERIVARASESDRVSFDEFIAHEALEMHDTDPNGMQKAAVIGMADYTILNDGTREDFDREIESVCKRLGL